MDEWGPAFWKILHVVAQKYIPGDEAEQSHRGFIERWIGVIPCDECRAHAAAVNHRMRRDLDAALSGCGGASLFEWSVGFHNAISRSLGKRVVTVAEANMALQSDGRDLGAPATPEEDGIRCMPRSPTPDTKIFI
jgi:hypothetical protein